MPDSVIWIVRHGNTFDSNDIVTRVGGRTDIKLSQSGKSQAENLGKYFSNIPFASAQSGPLKRTRQTAEIILSFNESKSSLQINEFLREIDYGPDENVPESEVVKRIGKEAKENWERNLIPPDGWKVNQNELASGWRKLISELGSINGHHLIVTSNGIARFALLASNENVSTSKLPTGGMGCIEISNGEVESIPIWGKRPDTL